MKILAVKEYALQIYGKISKTQDLDISEKLKEFMSPWAESIAKNVALLSPGKTYSIGSRKFIVTKKIKCILQSKDKILSLLLDQPFPECKDNTSCEIRDYLKTIKSHEKRKKLLAFCELLFDYEWFHNGKQPAKWNMNNGSNKIRRTQEHIPKGKYFLTLLDYWHLLDVRACPYCNLNVLEFVQVSSNDWERRRHSIGLLSPKSSMAIRTANTERQHICGCFDHFYPRHLNPYLGMSLKNLVPTCDTCNSRLKKHYELDTKDYIYPYAEDFDSIAQFSVIEKCGCGEAYNPNVSYDIYLERRNGANAEDFRRAKNSSDFFLLPQRISQLHSSYIYSVLFKCREYPEEYEKYLHEKFRIDYKEIAWHILGNFVDEKMIPQYPMVKLTIDLLRQFRVELYKKVTRTQTDKT